VLFVLYSQVFDLNCLIDLLLLKDKFLCVIIRLKEGANMGFDILFLGTGAADGMNAEFPDDFYNKNLRRCASALINGHILLDCGPHTLSSLAICGIDIKNITDIVVTHLHKDHLDLSAVNKIAKTNDSLKLYCREDAVFETEPECEICRMTPFLEYSIGELSVTGVPANHTQHPQHLSIEQNGKRVFYGLDGAWFLGETVEYLKNKKYNTFVFDATVGDYVGDYRMGEHNSVPMIRLMCESMKTLDIISENTLIVLSHIAMCLHKTHEETCATVIADGFTVAFDGMKIDI